MTNKTKDCRLSSASAWLCWLLLLLLRRLQGMELRVPPVNRLALALLCFIALKKEELIINKVGVINDSHVQPADPAGSDCRLSLKFWDGNLCENSDHYRPGLWPASWINYVNYNLWPASWINYVNYNLWNKAYFSYILMNLSHTPFRYEDV